MTYADWHADDRLPVDAEEFKQIETRVFAASPFLRQWFDRMDFQGQKVLDVGCGSGALSCRLAKMGARVTAIDITEAAVALARRNARAQGLDMDIVRMDAEDMALPPASFDFVFSWGVLHHTDDIGAAFREVSRVLRPGKSGLVMVYHRASAVYYLNGLKWLLVKGKLFRGHTLRSVQDFYTDGYYHRYLRRGEIAGLLAGAGLTARRISVTQYQKPILPFIPGWLDRALKARFGMCLVAEFDKPVD
ncbi:MAG: methyltransferase domain-containing protein [Proteobacteria bacterium]|nr:methyltransferase domain-containing protein [Pseudomonadota bacterium]